MSSITVKIVLGDHTSKTFKFSTDSSISVALKEIRNKVGGEGNLDHGLFQPSFKGKKPRWLQENRTFKFYNFVNGTELEFKKKHRIIRVTLLDDSQRSVMIDSSKPIREIIKAIADKLNIREFEEFGLRKKDAPPTAWLDTDKTLYEEDISEEESLLFAKILHASDFLIDSDDLVQIHLVYVQSLNSVILGEYDPLQKSEVVELAAVQMQILFGNYDQNRHKPGTLELAKLVPLSWRKDKRIEKEIIREYSKLANMKENQGKLRYVQIVRSLRTYGISLFEVVEKVKNKKKGNKVYIGITKDKILIIDFETREPIKEWEIEKLRKWAPTNNTLTLDFGDYEDDIFVFLTTEGEQMSRLISGYIDIKVKNQQEAERRVEDESGLEANVSSISHATGTLQSTVSHSYTTSTGSAVPTSSPMSQSVTQVSKIQPVQTCYSRASAFPQTQRLVVTDLPTALNAIKTLDGEMDQGLEGYEFSSNITTEQWRQQMASYQIGVDKGVKSLLGLTKMQTWDLNRIDNASRTLHANVVGLAIAAKNIASLETDFPVLKGAQAISESVAQLLTILSEAKGGESRVFEELDAVEANINATLLGLENFREGARVDRSTISVLNSCTNEIERCYQSAINKFEGVTKKLDPQRIAGLFLVGEKAEIKKPYIVKSMRCLFPVVSESLIQEKIRELTSDLEELVESIVDNSQRSDLPPEDVYDMKVEFDRLSSMISLLNDSMSIGEEQDFEGDIEIETQTNNLVLALSQIRKNLDRPSEIINPTKVVVSKGNQLLLSAKLLGESSESDTRERISKASRNTRETIQNLINQARILSKDPADEGAKANILEATARIESYVQDINRDAGKKAAYMNLRVALKCTTSKMIDLLGSSRVASASIRDQKSSEKLSEAQEEVEKLFQSVVHTLQKTVQDPDDPIVQNELFVSAKMAVPKYHDFLFATKRSQRLVGDLNAKQDLHYVSEASGDSIRALEKACKIVSGLGGQSEIEEAMIEFDSVKIELDNAEFSISQGLFSPEFGASREAAMELLLLSTKELSRTLEGLTDAARNGGKLPVHLANSAVATTQLAGATMAMASTVSDRASQKCIIATAKDSFEDIMQLIRSARILVIDKDEERVTELERDHTKVKSSLASLIAAGKGLDARELDGASDNIRNEAKKLSIGMESAPQNSNFTQNSKTITSVAKALTAATAQLVSTAKNNPISLGPAAKIVSATTAQLIQASNLTASSFDNDMGVSLLDYSKELASAMINLLESAKDAAANKDVESIKALESSNKSVYSNIRDLIGSLGEVSTMECDESSRMVCSSMDQIDKAPTDEHLPLQEILEIATEKYQALIGAVQRILTASQISGPKLGIYTKESAYAYDDLVRACNLISNINKESRSGEQCYSEALSNVEEHCKTLESEVDQVIIKSACRSTSILLGVAEEVKLKVSDDKIREEIAKYSQKIGLNSQRLARVAKVVQTLKSQKGTNDKLDECTNEVMRMARAIREDIRSLDSKLRPNLGSYSPAEIDPQAIKDIQESTKFLGSNQNTLISAAASISRNRNSENVKNLNDATSGITASINQLIAAYSSLNPGIQELHKFDENLRLRQVELDSKSVSIATSQTLTASDPLKTASQYKDELVNNTKLLAVELSELNNAINIGTPQVLASVSRRLRETADAFVSAGIDVVVTSPKETRIERLNQIKNLVKYLEQVSQAAQLNSDEKSRELLALRISDTAGVLSEILGYLQTGTAVADDLSQTISIVQEKEALLDVPMDVLEEAPGKTYADFRDELVKYLTKDLTDQMLKLTIADGDSTGVIGFASSRLSESIPKCISAIRGELATTDVEVRMDIKKSAHDLLESLLSVLSACHAVVSDPDNSQSLKSLQAGSEKVFSNISHVLSASKKGAIGEVRCEQAIDSLKVSLTELASNLIFAQAGQLKPQEGLALSLPDLRDQLIHLLESNLAEDIDGLAKSSELSQEEVGALSLRMSNTYTDTTKIAIQAASVFTSVSAQQELLVALKMLGMRLHQSVIASKEAQKDGSKAQLFDLTINSIRDSLAQCVNVVNRTHSEATAGEKYLEDSKQKILDLLSRATPYERATLEDAVRATRDISPLISDLVFSQSQEDLVKVSQRINSSMENLIRTIRASVLAVENQSEKQELLRLVNLISKSMCNLLDISKTSHQDPEFLHKVEQNSSELTESINSLLEQISNISGDLKSFDVDSSTYLNSLANDELEKCARIIEEAAESLLSTRPKRKPKDPSITDDETIADSILTAVQAITQSTGVLISAATQVQAKRTDFVEKTAIKRYHDDPTWANGLISAARNVSNSVRLLVKSCNNAVNGQFDQEVLIASARSVATATAQLFTASSVKVDSDSPIHNNLSKGAQAVNSATSKLVFATQEAAKWKEEHKLVDEEADNGLIGSAAAKFDQQIRILKLEAEIERERRALNSMNKREYQK